MRWLVDLCVRYAGTIATLTLVALLAGLWSARTAPLDVLPEFVPSTVDIQTEAPGFTAQQVEQLVTKPIENAVNGATGLATIRSQSIPGLSVINILFSDKIDLYNSRQGISERLSELGSALPLGVGTPKLSPLTSSTMDLLLIGLTSNTNDPFALRDAADWVMKPALLAVPGVAHVIVYGGAVRQIQIQPDLARMTSYGFTLTDLSDAARAALALKGAGFVDLAHQRVLIQTPVPSPDVGAISGAVLAVRSGTPITIGEIARVTEAPALRSGDALVQGKPGILLSLASQYGANTLDATRAVEAALAQLAPALKAQGITVYPSLQRPANFIERALSSLEKSLVIAAILILAVLYAFLRDWRSALITFLAIPLSLMAASAVLARLGDTLNTMTLGGFAVALGVLVDDAIIGIENVLRRLGENARSGEPRARWLVIRDATLEVRGPVVYATLVVIAVFLPELFSTSVQGHFVGPLALAFILAVMASLIVALTATPALSALMLKPRDSHADAGWIQAIKRWQRSAISFVYENFRLVTIVLGVMTVAAVAALPFLSSSFMPDFRENHFVMQVDASTPGASLEEMRAVGSHISADILALPYVATVSQQIGRAELGEDTSGPHQSEFQVELKPDTDVDQGDAENALREILTHYPGVETEVTTCLGDRISESLTGDTADISVKVFGDGLDALDSTAHRITTALTGTPGIADLQFKPQSGTPTLAVTLRSAALAASGLKAGDVLDALESDYAGTTVGQTYAGTRAVDVVMLLPETARNRPELLSSLMIAGPLGPVPLGQVARIIPTETRSAISHDGGQRFDSITFNVVGRSLQATVNDAKARVGALNLPAGIYVEFSGAAAAQQAAQQQMLIYTGFALVLIGMILFMCFHWRAHAWLVLVNLPFSLIGSVAAIALSGSGLSLGAMVGLVTVFGISARNAILLLAHYEHLVESEGASWAQGTVLRGAQERLVPILMTAAVTSLGLFAAGHWPASAGTGNRRPHGRDGAGRPVEFDAVEFGGASSPGGTFWRAAQQRSGGVMRRCALLAVLLAGCAQTPPPTLKQGDVPAAFEQVPAPSAPIWPETGWWRGFGNAELTSLIEAAQSGNLDIAQAEARLRQADARARQAGAALLPSVALNGNVNSLYGQNGGTSGHETDFSADLGASYELDFWGKNRAAADSASALRDASAADRVTVALTATAAVANDYFQLLSLRERLAVARANLKSSQDILNVVQRRVDAGYAPNSDLTQERANMAAEEAAVPALEQQELETRNALAILLGRPPEGFTVTSDTLTGIVSPALAPWASFGAA